MGAFLSGLLGAAGQDIEKQSDRKYQEKRQERQDRLYLLSQAASNPHFDQTKLKQVFEEMDDLAKDAGYKTENKVKNPFSQMGQAVQHILQRRKQQAAVQGQQQQARADVQGAPGVTAQPAQLTTPPMPASRFGVFMSPEQEQQREMQSAGAAQRQTGDINREQGTKDYELWKKRGQEMGLQGRELAEYAATKGTKLPSSGGGGLQKVWIKRPGSDDPEQVWVDPHNKEAGFFDMKEGKPIPPEGITSSGPPTQERLYGAIQGYYHHYLGQGYSKQEALARAGDDFRENIGKHLGRLEQQAAIDQVKSSIGLGRGFSPPTTPAPVQPGNVPRGTPAMPPPRIARPAAPAGPSAATAPLRSTLNPQELENADYFIGTLTGAQKGTGNAAVRTQLGQRALAKVGLTPEVLTARAERRKATAKAIDKITLMTDSVDGLEKALARHGAVLNTLRPQLPDTDVKKINEWLISGAREFNVKGISEAAVRYGLALQAVRNEYGRVIAGGASSAGQTHVEALKEAGDKMSEGFTTGNTRAMIDQIGIETQQRGGGYREKLKEMQDEMSQPLAPELRGGKYQEIQQTPPPGAGVGGGGSKRKVWNEATQSFEDR